MFNVKQGHSIKKACISPNIAPRGSECENNLLEVMAWESFPGVEFVPLTPVSRLNGVITLKCPYFTLIIGAMASEYKDRPSKVLAFKCFA